MADRPLTPAAVVEPRRRGPATFRERDVKAALRAARAAGETVAGFEISPDGRIRVIVGQEGIAAEKKNPWDEDLV